VDLAAVEVLGLAAVYLQAPVLVVPEYVVSNEYPWIVIRPLRWS
jgi:hypothetical protein